MTGTGGRFHPFPYREEEPRTGGPPVQRPTLDVTLTYSHQEITVRALVDTGAPFCIFGHAVAEALDIDLGLGRGRDRDVHMLGGVHQARLATVMFDLPPFPGLSWEAEAAFLFADLDLSFAGVLGQAGFLDRWVASFNYYDGYFIIEERDSFVGRLGLDPYEVFQQVYDSDWDRPTAH